MNAPLKNFIDYGFEPLLVEGIKKCRYFTPTPIQKLAIPQVCRGKDVVIMARTGSGKTATFLIPLLQKLKCRSANGIRSIIILPTRDLALQTSRFVRNIGYFMDLTCALIIGGEPIETQFLAILQNPDILIGTPGRILHILTEMSLKLNLVETVIIDEADRVYEMGLLDELKSIISLTAKNHQIILISATLPKSLIHFSSLEMSDPQFIRLDIDGKLSNKLKLCNIYVKTEQKISTLIYLLTKYINESQQTLIFTSSHFHVDMLCEVLKMANIPSSVSYSKMDEEDRQINVSNFRSRITNILISTDISARGLDIPSLDNVINFTFPSTAKVFTHRVGRAARAGREGCAYSLVSQEELPYLIDFYTYIGKEINFITPDTKCLSSDTSIGCIPQSIVDDIIATFDLKNNPNLKNMMNQIENAEKKIKKFVEKCSSESIKFVKSIDIMSLYPHPIFNINTKQFSTIGFVPKSKPIGNSLDNINFAKSQMNITRRKKSSLKVFDPNKIKRLNLSDFSHTSKSKKFIDSFCVSYRPIDDDSEKLYKMDEFKKNPHNLTVEFMSDELNDLKMKSKKGFKTRWDRKLKRYVNIEIQNNKKIKTESGVIIDTTYQTDHYKNWLNKTGIKSLLKSKKTDNKWSEKINKISNQLKDEKFNTVTNKNIKNVKKSSKNKFSKFTSKKRSSKN